MKKTEKKKKAGKQPAAREEISTAEEKAVSYVRSAGRYELESSTGYAALLTKVSALFKDIANTKKINSDGFANVANELAHIIRTIPLADVIAVINAISPVNEYLERHLINVAMLNGYLGIWLGLPAHQVDKLVLVGLLHDCGHALMPKEILYASRIFTKIDYEVIKMHTVRTDQLLAGFPADVSRTAGSHHERIDGSGYPKGISAQNVIGAARITAVADIYEAVVSTRPYRRPRSPFYAMAMMSDLTPWQIDNAVVNALIKNFPKELVDRQVTMSDGSIGIIREYDTKDIKYPTIEKDGRIIKTNEKLHCVSMYLDD